MKNSQIALLFLLLITCSLTTFSQAKESSQAKERKVFSGNLIDLGVGVGPNHGIVGARGILGYKGSGLLVGIGGFDGFTTFSIGGQLSTNHFYMSLIYGAYGSYSSEFNGKVDEGLLIGIVFTVGARINLIPSKRLFLEIGAGIYSGEGPPIPSYFSQVESGRDQGITFNLGLSYRLVVVD